jgi:GT2 family glycosyltransferase
VTGDGLVQVAYLHPHTVSHSWHESMMRMVAHDAAHDARVVATGGPFMIRCDSGGLVEARNLAVQRFLDETEHEWLWFIDTDMGFLPDVVDRLLAAADAAERPVVGALCFGLREMAYDGYGGRRVTPVPTLFMPATTPEGHTGFTTRWRFPEDTLVQVAGTGAACLLIHRSVLEKVRAEHGDGWFDSVRYGDGRPVSEDLSFCARLGRLGVPVFVHTGVKTTHHKQFWVSAADYMQPPEPEAVPGA